MPKIDSRRISDIANQIVQGLTHIQTIDEWCLENGISGDEWESVFDFAMRQADELQWMEGHRAQCGEFANTTATIQSMSMDADKTKVVMTIRGDRSGDVARIQPLIGQEVAVELYPDMMPLPLSYESVEGQQVIPGVE